MLSNVKPPPPPLLPGIGFGVARATAGSTPGRVIGHIRQTSLDAKLRFEQPSSGQIQSPGRICGWLGLDINEDPLPPPPLPLPPPPVALRFERLGGVVLSSVCAAE